MINESHVLQSSLAQGYRRRVSYEEEIALRGVEVLAKRLEIEFPLFLIKGVKSLQSHLDTVEHWDPPQEGQWLVSQIQEIDLKGAWKDLFEDLSLLQHDSLKESIKALFLSEISHRKINRWTARFLVALGEHLNLLVALDFLSALLLSGKGFELSGEKKDSAAALLKFLMEKDSLKEVWVENLFPTREDANAFGRFFIEVLLQLDCAKIEKYAKEVSFCLYDPSISCRYMTTRDPTFGVKAYHCELFRQVYSQGTKEKRDLFFRSLPFLFDGAAFEALLIVGQENRSLREPLEEFYLSLSLSREARGILLVHLLQDEREEQRHLHNEYIETLLRRGEPIEIPDWAIFLPLEGDTQQKKKKVQLLLQMIRDPKITHPLPLAWVATLIAYLLNLPVQPCLLPFVSRNQLGQAWVDWVTFKQPVELNKEAALLLIPLFDLLLTHEKLFPWGKEIKIGRSIENPLPIIQNIFVSLDALRLSAEGLKESPLIELLVSRVEQLMRKIENYFIQYGENLNRLDRTFTDPYTLLVSLFQKGTQIDRGREVLESIGALDPDEHPLLLPFLKSWNGFQGQKRASLEGERAFVQSLKRRLEAVE